MNDYKAALSPAENVLIDTNISVRSLNANHWVEIKEARLSLIASVE